MGSFGRLICRREAGAVIPHLREQVNWNGLSSVLTFPSLLAVRWASSAPATAASSRPREQQQQQRSVAVFWDLDNKPPKRVSPFEAAIRLKEMAGRFGDVVELVAYANHHAFAHVPTWVHEERRQRRVLDLLEATGEVKPSEPYVCGVCGAKKKTHVQLTKHFKMLHEREHRKRTNRLDSLKAKKKQKERFLENNAKKMSKYKDAARSIIYPKVGYGLMQDIRRAGVFVRTVKDEPQAADVALKEHMVRSIKRGVNCICLVSDDTDFKPELRMAKERRLHTVVVGDMKILGAYVDTYFSWAEVASGRAEQKAKLINGQLVLGEIPSSESGLTVREFELEDVPAEEDSEWVSDSDGDVRWRPMDRHGREDWDIGFDSFSDDASGSDLEESEMDTNRERQPKLLASRTRSRYQPDGGVLQQKGSLSTMRSRETGDPLLLRRGPQLRNPTPQNQKDSITSSPCWRVPIKGILGRMSLPLRNSLMQGMKWILNISIGCRIYSKRKRKTLLGIMIQKERKNFNMKQLWTCLISVCLIKKGITCLPPKSRRSQALPGVITKRTIQSLSSRRRVVETRELVLERRGSR